MGFPSIERKILAGDLAGAQSDLSQLAKKKIRREDIAEFAKLSRWSDMPLLSLRVLRRYLRPEKNFDATEEEKIEYAAALNGIGAVDEALFLLKSTSSPRALLCAASSHIYRWDYGKSIPLIEEYLKAPSAPLDTQIAKANLAGAYIFEDRFSEASRLLSELRESTHSPENQQLYSNVLELSARLSIAEKNWSEALDYLRRTEGLSTSELDRLFTQKWKAVIETAQTRDGIALLEVRDKAKKMNQWETVRDCDYWRGMLFSDLELLNHVYYGTPYPGYRRAMLRSLGNGWRPGEFYDWVLKKGRGIHLDLLSASSNKKEFVVPDSLLHHALIVLCSDFYRPIRMANLFQNLYPGEHFNPASSPRRTHELVSRLRKTLESHQIPVDVKLEEHSFALVATAPLVIRLVHEMGSENPLLSTLSSALGDKVFSSRDASRLLRLHPRKSLRLINEAIEKGLVDKHGAGRSARYSFKKAG